MTNSSGMEPLVKCSTCESLVNVKHLSSHDCPLTQSVKYFFFLSKKIKLKIYTYISFLSPYFYSYQFYYMTQKKRIDFLKCHIMKMSFIYQIVILIKNRILYRHTILLL